MHLAKIIGSAALGGVVPGLGMVALGMPVAAAAGVRAYSGLQVSPLAVKICVWCNAATCEQGFLAPDGHPEAGFHNIAVMLRRRLPVVTLILRLQTVFQLRK